ncbi:MAG: hypothetical protein IKJ55_06120 [Clostridia bacterium]|nr:hypothetical protein [Clostridia bacterium]
MGREVVPGPICGDAGNAIREAVCIHTDKVYDSCRDKECLEDLRVYLCREGQELIESALSVKVANAQILYVHQDVEPVPFNSGYYTIDIKFFFKVTLDVFCGLMKTKRIEGLAVYDKKVVLFGSEGKSKIFRSTYAYDELDPQMLMKTNMPQAVVEVVEPISLSAKIVEPESNCNPCCGCCNQYDIAGAPDFICRCFDDVFAEPNQGRQVYVTLGLFSIVKLERNVQLLIPVYDFCVPEGECVGTSAENPCELFDRIEFPVDEFYPPQKHDFFDTLPDGNGCGNCRR